MCLSVSRRSRKYATKVGDCKWFLIDKTIKLLNISLTSPPPPQPKDWVPSLQNPFHGSVVFAKAETIEFTTTLYKDPRSQLFEDKQWTFTIEDVDSMGKRRPVASTSLNMREYISFDGNLQHVTLEFKCNISVSSKTNASRARANLNILCTFIKEGAATDEDMQSLASIMSLQNAGIGNASYYSGNNTDIANFADFDDERMSESMTLSRKETKEQIAQLAEQFGLLAKEADSNDFDTTLTSEKVVFVQILSSTAFPHEIRTKMMNYCTQRQSVAPG